VQLPDSGKTYAPRNFDGHYLGPITVRKALALSRNTCAVRVGQEVGPAKIVEVAQAAGINSKLEPTLALSLGASAVSPLDMADAYSTLARSGVHIQPQFIRKITDANGRTVQEYYPSPAKVFDEEPVAELVDALQDVVQKGTARQARLFDRPVAGKTGTADGARDIWFVGFTPDMVTAVWGGNDQDQPIAGNQVTGGTIMAGIWQRYMDAYYAAIPTPPGEFPIPDHPFIEEPEPLHFLPQPAGIFGDLGQMPPLAPQLHAPRGRHSDRQSDNHPHKGGLGKFFKKLMKWF
jgi:penicillin-binding protein 1A